MRRFFLNCALLRTVADLYVLFLHSSSPREQKIEGKQTFRECSTDIVQAAYMQRTTSMRFDDYQSPRCCLLFLGANLEPLLTASFLVNRRSLRHRNEDRNIPSPFGARHQWTGGVFSPPVSSHTTLYLYTSKSEKKNTFFFTRILLAAPWTTWSKSATASPT